MNPFLKNCYRVRNLFRRIVRPVPSHSDPSQLYEALCNLIDGDVVVKASQFKGKFRVDPRSHLFRRLLLNNSFEPDVVRICLGFSRLGGDFLDIGANVGFYSVLMAQTANVGKILAVEPVVQTLDRLRENLSLNEVAERVIVYAGAMLDSPGEVVINVPIGNEEFASQGKMTHAALEMMPNLKFDRQIAPTDTLDHLVEQHQLKPSLIKIDTEGTEHLVFRSGIATLREYHPVIVAEINNQQLVDNGSSAIEVMKLIKECGYESYDVKTLLSSDDVYDYGEILFVAEQHAMQHQILNSLRANLISE